MITKNVIGTEVAACSYETAFDWIKAAAVRGDRAYAVEAANTHVLALARSNKRFGNALEHFDLVCPDGMPLVWCLNQQLGTTEQLKDRVYGPTLMLEALKRSANDESLSHFFFGGRQETIDTLTARFAERFPYSKIAGSYSPPFGTWSEEEQRNIKSLIKDSGANLIWVGLGCPKQEQWIAENLSDLPAGVYFGIGAAFAFHAGEVAQAPGVLQRLGLEWCYRLLKEPKRLFRRYFTYNTLFCYYFLKDKLKSADS